MRAFSCSLLYCHSYLCSIVQHILLWIGALDEDEDQMEHFLRKKPSPKFGQVHSQCHTYHWHFIVSLSLQHACRPLSQGWMASLTGWCMRGIASLVKGFLHLIENPFLCTGLLFWRCMTGALLNSWLILGCSGLDLEQLECLRGEDVLLTNFRGPFLVICRDCRNWGLLIQTSRQLPNRFPQLWLIATHVEDL